MTRSLEEESPETTHPVNVVDPFRCCAGHALSGDDRVRRAAQAQLPDHTASGSSLRLRPIVTGLIRTFTVPVLIVSVLDFVSVDVTSRPMWIFSLAKAESASNGEAERWARSAINFATPWLQCLFIISKGYE